MCNINLHLLHLGFILNVNEFNYIFTELLIYYNAL